MHHMTVLSTSYIKLFDQILTWFSLAVAVVVINGSYNLFMTDLMQDEEERSQTARRGEPYGSFKLLFFYSKFMLWWINQTFWQIIMMMCEKQCGELQCWALINVPGRHGADSVQGQVGLTELWCIRIPPRGGEVAKLLATLCYKSWFVPVTEMEQSWRSLHIRKD